MMAVLFASVFSLMVTRNWMGETRICVPMRLGAQIVFIMAYFIWYLDEWIQYLISPPAKQLK